MHATAGGDGQGQIGGLSLSKSDEYCAWALARMAAFAHGQTVGSQKLPLNTATQSESCVHDWS